MNTTGSLNCSQFRIVLCGSAIILAIAGPTLEAGGWHFAIGYGHHGHGHHSYGHHGYGHYGYGRHSHGHYGYGHHLGYGYRGYGYSHYRPYGYHDLDRPSYNSYYRPRTDYYRGGYDYNRGHNGPTLPATPSTNEGYVANASRDADHHLTRGRGWGFLTNGNAEQALYAFGEQASCNPLKGGPKVGYALSAAVSGDLSTGVWAMRRACRLDPQAMHYVHLDKRLRPQVETLIESYQTALNRDGGNSPFMLAALHYLTGDTESAHTAIELASRNGDRSQSTRHLKRLIDEKRAEGVLFPTADTPSGDDAPSTAAPAESPQSGRGPPTEGE